MDVGDENIQTLLAMGFPSEAEIRRALKLGKNDLSEAVAILTNENQSTTYDTLDDLDVEMKDMETRPIPQAPVYGPALPPSYDEVVEPQTSPVSLAVRIKHTSKRRRFWSQITTPLSLTVCDPHDFIPPILIY